MSRTTGGIRRLVRSVEAALARGGRSSREPIEVRYQPDQDGTADPGEVVWAWVPYEEDPGQGKDRPLVVVGTVGARLAAVVLTTKVRPGPDQVAVGSGPWDHERRPSFARLDRVVALRPETVRREGSALERRRFDQLVVALSRRRGWPRLPVQRI